MRAFKEGLKSHREETEIRDESIGRQLDEIAEKERGNILLFLGAGHLPSLKKTELVRIGHGPDEYKLSHQKILEEIRDLDEKQEKERLLRAFAAVDLAEYWIAKKAHLKAAEVALKALRPLRLMNCSNYWILCGEIEVKLLREEFLG